MVNRPVDADSLANIKGINPVKGDRPRMPAVAGAGGTPFRFYLQGDAEMMSMMTRRTVLPFLLALALLLAAGAWWWQAGPTWADGPQEGDQAHQHAAYDAPTVTIKPHHACNISANVVYVLASFRNVGATGYQQQIAWGHDANLSGDDIPWGVMHRSPKPAGSLRALTTDRSRQPEVGKGYSLRVRGVDADGNHGPWGEGTYVYSEGTAAPPASVTVSAVDGDYSRARLRWKDGSDGAINGFGFKIQRQSSGSAGWVESRWKVVRERVVDGDRAYDHVVTGLDPTVSHRFRVAAQAKDCTPTGWSQAVTLSPPAPPAAPEFTVTVSYGTSSPSLLVTPVNAPESVTSYSLVHRVKDSGNEFTDTTVSKSDAVSGIRVSGLFHGTTYRVGLRATNAVGDGEYSYRDVTVSALPDPPAFTVTPAYTTDNVSLTVQVTTPVTGATSYALRVNGTTTTVAAGEFSGDGYSVPASLGTDYTVAMATVNSVGRGAFSADHSLTTLSLPSQPSATAEAQYSGNSASIMVTVASAAAADQLQGYLVRHRKASDENAEWSATFVTPGVAQSGYSFNADLGASYSIEVSGLNAAGQGDAAALTVSVKARPDAPDFTAEAVYSDGSATVLVKVKPGGSDVLDYSVRYRASATDSWNVATVTTAQAQSGWSFTAEPGATYSVGVAARTEVGLGGYGAATVSIVSRVNAPEFTVTVSRSENGAVARVAVSNPQQQAQYHMFSMDDAAPVKAEVPDAEHEFSVVLGTSYRFGVAAGNQLGTGDYAYQDITALVVPDAPSFTLAPVYRNGSAHLAVQVANPDPHASRYLLKVGDADAVTHTGLADLRVPVAPGDTYTVALAAGNAAGDSAYTTVTRDTTTAEYEALLEWRLILPQQATPGEAVGAATQYVAIVNGAPVRYDPVPPCVDRETARATADLARATALAGWVNGTADASADLSTYATSHQTAMATALTAAETVARPVCAARYPTVENLGNSDARWVRLPR